MTLPHSSDRPALAHLPRLGGAMSSLVAGLVLVAGLLCTPSTSAEGRATESISGHEHVDLHSEVPAGRLVARDHSPCIDGQAEGYSCEKIDLEKFMPLADLGGASSANDIWGWTDGASGREFALVGVRTGTAFVEVTDPQNAVYLGFLPTQSGSSSWRDIKVHADHALIVSEAVNHGMQVFHLGDLLNVAAPPVTFTTVAHYDNFGRAHNIVVNEDTGVAFAVGSRQGTTTCAGGLHMIDVADPHNPSFLGCFSADGYTHDAQCVTYQGPDSTYAGSEICFNSNEDTLTIVDVTDKSNPTQISRTPYTGRGYTHQGWLTEDHRYFLLDDETDELGQGHNTKTRIWDVRNLANPSIIGEYLADLPASDHNLYTKDGFAYLANYRSGLRVLSLDQVANGTLSEIAHFDTYTANDNAGTQGAWSVYPYFDSGTVVVNSIGEGLFILRPQLCAPPAMPTGLNATTPVDNRVDLSWNAVPDAATYNVYRGVGACPGAQVELVAPDLAGTSFMDLNASGTVEYSYTITASDSTGSCESVASSCTSIVATGLCTAPPLFDGLGSTTNLGTASCAIELDWPTATPLCGGVPSYRIYRSQGGGAPTAGGLIAQVATSPFTDTNVVSGQPYSYLVRAFDPASGAEDDNTVVLSATPSGPPIDGIWATGGEIGDPLLSATTGNVETGGLIDHIGWELLSSLSHSGERSYYSTYADEQCSELITPPIDLTGGESSELSLWTRFDVESSADGGIVEISADGGSTWTQISPSGGYPGSLDTGNDACGLPSGTPAFTGFQDEWLNAVFDLSAWNGQQVRVRFRFSTDDLNTLDGWYLDTLNVSHAQVAGTCESAVEVFTDGFETGTTGAWSSSVSP